MAPREAALKLRAEDADDLAIISACVQDALVSVRDLAYDRAARSFVLIANRFRWEAGAAPVDGVETYERTLCAVAFAAVDSVAYRGFRRSDEGRILSLLAIRAGRDGGETTIDLDFAGGPAIRLTAQMLSCHLSDLGDPWPTLWQPDHPVDGPQ